MTISESFISKINPIAVEAGNVIMSLYSADIVAQLKEDSTPITEADQRAHSILVSGLYAITQDIPVISEEDSIPNFEDRCKFSEFWLIDPLDGTKEFINKNDEFTINIALLKNFSSEEEGNTWQPIFGLVYQPAKDQAYIGWTYDECVDDIIPGEAYVVNDFSHSLQYWRMNSYPLRPIKRIDHANLPLRILTSRSHGEKATEDLIQKIETDVGEIERIAIGSSLKLCRIADGSAHVYPRFAASMEWDIAAGHAVCRATGVSVLDINTQKPLQYNKQSLKNSGIYVTAIPTLIDFLCGHIN